MCIVALITQKFTLYQKRVSNYENDEKLDFDVEEWQSWKWPQILGWILSVGNGRFRKYKADLSTNLRKEAPTGEDLAYFKEDDLRRWGFKWSDPKVLHGYIQQLVNNTDGEDEMDVNGHGLNDQNEGQEGMRTGIIDR